MQYLLDTNTFIEAKNDYYRFCFCPGFWSWIRQKNQASILFTVDKIKAELLSGNDDLKQWTQTCPSSMFIRPNQQLSASLVLIAEWVDSQNYTDAAKTIFFSSADYFLIAYAHSLGYTVVTRERRDPNSKGRVKIPDVCVGVSVPYISPFQLLQDERANFVCSPN